MLITTGLLILWSTFVLAVKEANRNSRQLLYSVNNNRNGSNPNELKDLHSTISRNENLNNIHEFYNTYDSSGEVDRPIIIYLGQPKTLNYSLDPYMIYELITIPIPNSNSYNVAKHVPTSTSVNQRPVVLYSIQEENYSPSQRSHALLFELHFVPQDNTIEGNILEDIQGLSAPENLEDPMGDLKEKIADNGNVKVSPSDDSNKEIRHNENEKNVTVNKEIRIVDK